MEHKVYFTEGTAVVTGSSTISNEKWTVICSEEGYKKWRAGTLIQRALPELTANQRELLLTGYTEDDWNSLFKEEEKA